MLLGIDSGTTAVKLTVLNGEGENGFEEYGKIGHESD